MLPEFPDDTKRTLKVKNDSFNGIQYQFYPSAANWKRVEVSFSTIEFLDFPFVLLPGSNRCFTYGTSNSHALFELSDIAAGLSPDGMMMTMWQKIRKNLKGQRP